MADPDQEPELESESEPASTAAVRERSVSPKRPADHIKAQKMAKLNAQIEKLNNEIMAKTERLEALKRELKFPASTTVENHIRLLHQYNEIRDVGQGLLGMVAEKRNCRVADLYAGTGDGDTVGEFGVGRGD